jgi:hypothetical protein
VWEGALSWCRIHLLGNSCGLIRTHSLKRFRIGHKTSGWHSDHAEKIISAISFYSQRIISALSSLSRVVSAWRFPLHALPPSHSVVLENPDFMLSAESARPFHIILDSLPTSFASSVTFLDIIVTRLPSSPNFPLK